MEQQIASKDVNATQVEEKIQKDIADQEVAVKEKTAIYLSQTERKKEEEKELLKILKDYRQKFTEFDKANRRRNLSPVKRCMGPILEAKQSDELL